MKRISEYRINWSKKIIQAEKIFREALLHSTEFKKTFDQLNGQVRQSPKYGKYVTLVQIENRNLPALIAFIEASGKVVFAICYRYEEGGIRKKEITDELLQRNAWVKKYLNNFQDEKRATRWFKNNLEIIKNIKYPAK